MTELSRRDVLIAMAQAGVLTPERALFVRSETDTAIRAALVTWQLPSAVLAAAGMPAFQFRLNRRQQVTPEYVQTQVDAHLIAKGLDPVPIKFVHPHLADRLDLHADWEDEIAEHTAPWAHHRLHHRVARILAAADRPHWQPLVALIERGIHPYGLDASGDYFILVDPKADHDAVFRLWDELAAEDV